MWPSPWTATDSVLEEREAEAVERIRSWVATTIGLKIDEEAAALAQRLEPVCRKLSLSIDGLRERLERGDHGASISVAEEVSTNHTFFLREPRVFEFLSSTIIPGLPAIGEIRIWSAATSSGEEAYSLAICARRALGGLEARDRVRILGTDISERQIRHAERGVFQRRALASASVAIIDDFEVVDGAQLRVRPRVASMCVFRRMNLAQLPWPFAQRFHVVFLRNVLYYFDVATRRRVLDACWDAIEPGGWLVTSVTEPLLEMARWESCEAGVYRKPPGTGPRR